MRIALPILAALLLATAVGAAQDSNPKTAPMFPTDVRVERYVAFLPESRKERADLYFPLEMPATGKLPAVVWIHGGGWISGQRNAKRELSICSTLARHGYVAMSIDYLLSDHHQAVWPTNLWDCKLAVRWLRKNAVRLGVDPERLGVMGGSAGGHLAAMVALTTPTDGLDPVEPFGDVSCRVRCGVDFYGHHRHRHVPRRDHARENIRQGARVVSGRLAGDLRAPQFAAAAHSS